MNVRELIKHLSVKPQDAQVKIEDPNVQQLLALNDVSWVQETGCVVLFVEEP